VSRRPTHASLAGDRYLALRALARAAGRPTAELLQLYALEGFLARLSRSPYLDRLVLKGSVLLAAFEARRPTRDVDLLAVRTPNEVSAVRDIVAAVASEPVEDGIAFDPASTTAETIREDDAYPGLRVTLHATLASARLVFHVDVNVGDPVWPAPEAVRVPRLLEPDPILVMGYPLPMVLAEKVVTAVQRGTASTRWRDFADIALLSSVHPVDGDELRRAIGVVAEYRRVALVPLHDVLAGFVPLARRRWDAWYHRQALSGSVSEDFAEVLDRVEHFANPILGDGFVPGVHWEPAAGTWVASPSPIAGLVTYEASSPYLRGTLG
jgi:hypothetical protein